MSTEPSALAMGLSMELIDGRGWPLSKPEATFMVIYAPLLQCEIGLGMI